MGKHAGVSKVMVAQWETGSRKPGVDSLYTLSKSLGVSFAWLAVGEGDQSQGASSPTEESAHNPELNKACADMVIDFLRAHNLMNEMNLLPELIEDLYDRAAKAGLDKTNRSRSAFRVALKDLATITIRLA